MATTRLGTILEQEYKSKGLISGASSALGKRAMEKMDIRNSLFGGSGLSSIIGKKIFGKGYSATRDVNSGSGVSSVSQEISENNNSQLDELIVNARITAKNTLSFPSMARDMHLVKQNIIKLVKLQGGTPQLKAGDWFQRQAAREAAYESKFGNSNKPTKVNTPNSDAKKISENSSMLSDIFGTLGKNLLPLVGIAALVGTALGGLSKVIFGVLALVMRTRLGKLLGLSAAALGLNSISSGGDTSTDYRNMSPSDAMEDDGMSLGTKAALGVGAYGVARAVGRGVNLTRQTKDAMANARVASNPYVNLAGGNTTGNTKWAKFLKFVERRAPKLFAKLGTRLAAMGAMMAIPFVGWIGALINFGFTLWAAWEIYSLWKEFTGQEDSESPVNNTRPTQISSNVQTEMVEQNNSTSTTPISLPKGQAATDMADLIRKRFKDAGFNSSQTEAAVANAIAESGLNPSARNNNGKEDSVGLFQMNRKGGLGAGHSVEDLMDPNYNIDLAIAAAKKSKAFMAATSVDDAVAAFVKDVERPANQSAAIQKRIQIARGLDGNSGGAGYESLASADIAGGAALNGYSQEVASGYRTGSQSSPVIVNNQTTNNNGSNNGGVAPPAANVLDNEFAKLLSRMV
jgi:hypothetical protein